MKHSFIIDFTPLDPLLIADSGEEEIRNSR